MLHGIDVSNWQKGLEIPESLDFCIVKATEGLRFVDWCCDGFVQQCKRKGILWGFYHFARNNKPEDEALFFYNNTVGYIGDGIPVLDIEDEGIGNWGEYAQRFVDKFHACSGVYPIIYASASTLRRFVGYPIVDDCGLWVAGYPDVESHTLKDIPTFRYDISPWKFAAIWQFTASGKLQNYDDYVDMDVAYMDRDAWKLYANPEYIEPTTQIEIPTDSKPKNEWSFENDKIKIDITLK